MLALIGVVTVVVVLLAVLVAGLLRSHADILRALHDLGAGVGDPTGGTDHATHDHAAQPVPVPLHMGPPLPGERNASSAPDLVGVSPEGDAVAIGVTGVDRLTLLAFLSSGCVTCAEFWASLRDPVSSGFPPGLRVVAVTKGPEFEIPSEVARRAGGRIAVVMSTESWGDYEVPGSPFFVLIDGRAGRRIGEGVANRADQIADLVRRAWDEERPPDQSGSRSRAAALGLDGKEREARNDQELQGVGILPGDPSLYPERHEDLFATTASPSPITGSGPASPQRQAGAKGR
ncbi:MAG TPA: hypothetical protein VND67_09140 [Acidimicrobiales bacterium]|nr:hypothetical protein [Acidimicrobiales bacterium]